MLGRLVRALILAVLEERALYEGEGIVTSGEAQRRQVDRLVAELDKITAPGWELLRDAVDRDLALPEP